MFVSMIISASPMLILKYKILSFQQFYSFIGFLQNPFKIYLFETDFAEWTWISIKLKNEILVNYLTFLLKLYSSGKLLIVWTNLTTLRKE